MHFCGDVPYAWEVKGIRSQDMLIKAEKFSFSESSAARMVDIVKYI